MAENQNIFEHLPVSSFADIKKLIEDREATIGVRKDLALECAHKGVFISQSNIKKVQRLVLVPYITALLFIGYIIYSGEWGLLLTIPALIIGYFVLHPNLLDTLGIRRLISVILVGVVITGFYNRIFWLFITSLILLINHFSQSIAYSVSVNGIKQAALENEDTFRKLWAYKVISLHMKDGSSFYQDFNQQSDGEFIHYENSETSVKAGRPSEKEMQEFLTSHLEFFRGILQSSSQYWKGVINTSNNFKTEEGIKVTEELRSKDFTSECLNYGYALTFIGLLKEAGEQRYSNFGILFDLGLQGAAIDLIVEHEKEKSEMTPLSENDIDNIKEQSINQLVDAGMIVGDYFDAEESGEDSPEDILANYFIDHVNLDTEDSHLPDELRKKISSLTKEVIDHLAKEEA